MTSRASEMLPLLILLSILLVAWLPVRLSYFFWTKRLQWTFGDWFMLTFALGVVLALASALTTR